MIKGKIKWFDIHKGYGFITDEDGNDHFVHFSSISKGRIYRGFEPDDEVMFEIGEGKKGNEAKNVSMINNEEESNE